MLDIASYLLEDLLPFQFRDTPIGPAYNGRLVMAKTTAELVSNDSRINAFRVIGDNPINSEGISSLPHSDVAHWASGADAAWFEPGRHYWWRSAIIRDTVGHNFPIVTMLHSLGYPEQLVPLMTCVSVGARPYDVIVAPGPRAAALLEEQLDQVCNYLGRDRSEAAPRVEVIPYGVGPVSSRTHKTEAKRNLDLPIEGTLVTFVGRMVDGDKIEFERTMDALAKARKSCDFTVVFAGAASEAAERRVIEVGRQLPDGTLRVMPNITDSHKEMLLDASDIFLSPSQTVSEMFGLSIVEAMQRECAVLCSGWGGYLDVVEDGVTGLEIDTVFNDPTPADELAYLTNVGFNTTARTSANVAIQYDDLAAKLVTLVRNPELRGRLGREARLVAEQKFDVRSTAVRVVDIMLEARDECDSSDLEGGSAGSPLKMASSFRKLAKASVE